VTQTTTFIEALIAALERAGRYNKNDQVSPAAILWPDKDRQWEPLLPLLRDRLPLLTLGEYTPEERTGPAYWLRCMLARTLSEDKLPPQVTPIVYLPGVSKQDLRAVESCPKYLQPLAELQYRGVLWVHRNGRDWTIAGFLQTSEGGLDIPVGADQATKEALKRALLKLAYEPLTRLKKEAPLRAPFLDALLNPDEVRRLLLWLNDPEGYPNQISSVEWESFCGLCRRKYNFHPLEDGPVTAGQLLGEMKEAWAVVWQRYVESPEAYPNLPERLRQARPQQLALLERSPAWPQDTETAEAQLRQSLLGLGQTLPDEVRTTLKALEQEHGERRTWVWAKLGRSPLVFALQHLVTLARITKKTLSGANLTTLAGAYVEWGWQADAAVLDALATVERAEDVQAVKTAIVPLYRPWLEQAAQTMQKLVAEQPNDYVSEPPPTIEPGTCLLFSDALRFDAAQRLITDLNGRGFNAKTRWRLTTLPTVTPTAKPAIAPVAAQISGEFKPGLVPAVRETGSTITATGLRKLLEAAGYQVLLGDDLGDPSGRAWAELGAIDQYGHQNGWKIAHHLGAELRGLAGRVEALLNHGWQQVIVITDHGWLMLPQGLPKVELPQHLTLTRKGRCAVLKPNADTEQQVVPWHWDKTVRIAVATGIGCYEAGKEYEHGGLSPQECVVPLITVSAPAGAVATVAIETITWTGLRCNLTLSEATVEMRVDIRTKAGDPATSLVSRPKSPRADGSLFLNVLDDEREGEAALIVVLDKESRVLAQTATMIGG
jgi:hypothetical protein